MSEGESFLSQCVSNFSLLQCSPLESFDLKDVVSSRMVVGGTIWGTDRELIDYFTFCSWKKGLELGEVAGGIEPCCFARSQGMGIQLVSLIGRHGLLLAR